MRLTEPNRSPSDSLSLARALFDSPHQLIYLLAIDGRLIDANAKALELGGMALERLQGMPLWRTPWWPDCQQAGKVLVRAIPKALRGDPVRFPATWKDAQGEPVDIDFSLRTIKDEAGTVIQLLLEGLDVTAQRRAEASLQERSALLDGFFQAAPVGMVIMDRNLRYLHINEMLAAFNNLPASAHIGKTLNEVIPTLATEVSNLYRRVLHHNEPIYDLPVSGCLPDTPELMRHWRVSLFPIADETCETAFLGGVVLDVTERIEAEIALHSRTTELGEAQRLARVGSWEWLPDSDTLHWSPEIFRITGLAPESQAPRKRQQAALYRPEGWQQLREGFKRLLAGEAAYAIDLEIFRPDGNRRWVIARAEAERDDAGQLIKVRGTVQDITERKLAENEVHELAREVMDLYEKAPCGYHSLDSEGYIVRINDTELDWLGYTRDEVLGRKLTDFMTPASRRLFAANFPLLKRQGSIRDIEQEMVRKDGSILPLLLNSTAVFDERGHFVMSRATAVDMTEKRKLAEERLRQEARRAEISRHLIDVQEEERRHLAVEVHDVVSPNLSAVQINLGILEAGLSRETMKNMGPRLNDIRQLIRDTNDRLREICANLRPSLLDYAGLYAAVDSYARQFTERTGVTVEISGGEADGRLPGNVEILLFRIVQEALVNCAKHAQADCIGVELSYDCQHAYLEINDNGTGFEPGELTANGHKPGLGLLTMAERAEFAGGKFKLESWPGKGTRITVEI